MAMIAVLAFLMAFCSAEAATDLTVTDKATGTDVVEAVIDIIQQSCIFSDDRLMLRRIAAVETEDGQHSRTFVRNGVDYYGGIWQVDERVFETTKVSSNATVYNQIKVRFNIDWPAVKYSDLWKPLYSGLAARLVISSYYRATSIPQDVQSQSRYWAAFFTSNPWGGVAAAEDLYKEASNRTATRCSSPKADVIFVLDSSGSITSTVFSNVRQFAVDVVRSFVIGSEYVRVSVIQFSDVARTEFDLRRYNTTTQLVDAIYGIPYMNSGTNTPAGLRALQSVVEKQGRFEFGVPVVSILMTDGRSNDRIATINTAKQLHQDLDGKLAVYAMGVGANVDSTELEAIASSPSCQYVFQLTSFNDITAFSYQIMKSACRVPANLPEDRPVTGVVRRGESYYFKARGKKSKRGIVITIKTPIGGKVRIFVSWTVQNPSRALYDYSDDVDSSSINGVSVMVPWPADNRRLRRDVTGETNANETVVDGPMMTLYGAIEGVGEHETGNRFELSYAISDRLPSSATAMSVNLSLQLSLLAIWVLLRGSSV